MPFWLRETRCPPSGNYVCPASADQAWINEDVHFLNTLGFLKTHYLYSRKCTASELRTPSSLVCYSQAVAACGNESRRKLREGEVAELPLPPEELRPLAPGAPLRRQDLAEVPVEQLCCGVARGLGRLEEAAFEDRRLRLLGPALGIPLALEGGGLKRVAFETNFDVVAHLAAAGRAL